MAPNVPIDFTGLKESRKCSVSQMMGKSRKYSKGHSSAFVPNYRHAVETMAESEGFGSSGRVDPEITISEDSYALKRKCISLIADGCDSFVVPLQVLSLSKMSQSERKELELRLKMELEQVQILQRKVASLSSNVVVLSPSSDIRSCSDGKKRPPLESLWRSTEVSALHGKKRAPAGRNGSCAKKSSSGLFEPVKLTALENTSNALLMEKCKMLLHGVMLHKYAWIFNEPVDVVKSNIPDYFTVIKHPMDLGTVKRRIDSGEYSSALVFASDVRLTFSNALTYNPPGNDVHHMAKTLGKYFEARWKAIEKKLSLTTDEQSVPLRAGDPVESEITTQIPPAKRKKILTENDTSMKLEPVRQIMTSEERLKLSSELEPLLAELPESIVDFLKEHSAGQTNEEEIEIDIDALSDVTVLTLRKLLDDYMLERQKNQDKDEPCEIDLPNEFSGNDLVDEDVDIIGGNDPPVSSYSPVEIKKDVANRNSKCSSSSSSSSESGASSNDSESGSSSRRESDAAKASVAIVDIKENLGSGATLDQKKNDLGDSEIENSELLGDIFEQNSQCKPMSAEADDHQEGESAPSESQVSPEKLYRADLLRWRFADTILKAREKALEKGEKRDPERLRLEREELERRQKEEKARLQAEAKAAEEFRRKAEADAAAEAKKKRELEREAARQALLKMEKTVDMNENSQFMEDLEMLTAVHDEHLPSFPEEISPDHSQNGFGFGSFKLQGNPLEQLGLYMKVDDEDEEEPPKSTPEPSIDVEEGEID
ncbi:LOW QUALITY PROTEIN: transcription factor GTE10-like [Juglans microcarpa x Juglans regia]|uniref:LOW QUALITY PROTEIN: transcription factor GTE10-like n=1 Tax=Juglans microcarpa x Juglans regia TaxID=2249226 RepID=UPI001B7EFFCA|nr:LOW QUALITY PROTEIN: transcription factor GTE10-like [Juglans microcarpa x Juglans regia]